MFCETKHNSQEVPLPESYLNIVARFQPAAFLRNRLRHRYFPAIILHTFKFSGARKFLMTF